jgi:putative ATP-binding cassette transporter
MSWIALLTRESTVPIRRIAMGSAMSGACRSAVLGTVIGALGVVGDYQKTLEYLFFFILLVVAYKLLHAFELERISAEVEDIAHRMRTRIIDKLQCAELRHHEKISRAEVLAGLNNELPAITRAVITLFNAIQAGTTIGFTLFFIGSMSQVAFFFIFFGGAATVSAQVAIFRRIRKDTGELYPLETSLNEVVADALEGFRETKLDGRKRAGVLGTVSALSDRLTKSRKKVQKLLSQQLVIAQVSYMVMVGVVVFVAPKVDAAFEDTILRTAISMIFLMGPLNTFVGTFQVLINVNAAAHNVMELEATIDALAREDASADIAENWARQIEAIETAQPIEFKTAITLSAVGFVHHTTPELHPFRIGPIDLDLKRGEIMLIVGGNGSGKSTVLKVLTGLYRPTSGSLAVDGVTIGSGNVQQYREHFGVIFADHHLFTRLYGLEAVDLARLAELMDLTGLTGKTSYTNGRFDTIKLSTGQRKRLALVEMLMEDKQILVFDEWAAEQDPPSRARFYGEILPDLKAKGKTIIAVSHDDAFFHIADVTVRMELGKIASLERRNAGQ